MILGFLLFLILENIYFWLNIKVIGNCLGLMIYSVNRDMICVDIKIIWDWWFIERKECYDLYWYKNNYCFWK